MKIKTVLVVAIVALLLTAGYGLRVWADETRPPVPKSFEVIFESPKANIAIAVMPDNTVITVVIFKGKYAQELSKNFGGATSLYSAEKHVLILFDTELDI